MHDLDAVVRALMRDVGERLRPLGFRGSRGVWRLATAEGLGVIQRQGSQGSTSAAKLFYLNTAVVPTAWWRWHHSGSAPIDQATDADGIRLLEHRVMPPDPLHTGHAERTGHAAAGLWRVAPDTDVDRLRANLVTAVARASARLAQLLEPGRYLEELSTLPEKDKGHWHALVILLAERGPSTELRAACAGLRDAFADRPSATGHIEQLIDRALTGTA